MMNQQTTANIETKSPEDESPETKSWSRRSILAQSIAAAALGKLSLDCSNNGLLAAGLSPNPLDPTSSVGPMATSKRFLTTLDDQQLRVAVIPFDTEKRVDWHFIPMDARKGLPLRDMTQPQRDAALAILQQVLSPAGYQRALDIFAYEAILLELEGPAAAKRRDYTKYHFTFFGEPSDEGQWGLSVEGHHLSLNFTFEAGKLVDSTPQFFGVNPANLKKSFTIPDIAQANKQRQFSGGARLLASEEDSAFALLKTFRPEQLDSVVWTAECPDDIQWAGLAQPQSGSKVGMQAKDMTKDQALLLQGVLNSFNANMSQEVIEQRNSLIKEAGIDQIYFGWAGAKDIAGQHYYRIQGPTFIAEFCNFQKDPQGNIANHIHAVWRDMTGDFNLPVAIK
jgi:hypothetical protein